MSSWQGPVIPGCYNTGRKYEVNGLGGVESTTGICVYFNQFDMGCCCDGCNSAHDAYCEALRDGRVYKKADSLFEFRVKRLKAAGWPGIANPGAIPSLMHDYPGGPVPYPWLVVTEAWSKDGYVCKRCNSRNPYAGPEHLKDGVYICYECK